VRRANIDDKRDANIELGDLEGIANRVDVPSVSERRPKLSSDAHRPPRRRIHFGRNTQWGSTGVEPTRRFAALEKQETLEMNRIVTRDFVAKLGSLRCQAGVDANVTLTIDGHSQDISTCALSDAPSLTHDLVTLLSRHRFATHDIPARPLVPTGEGDSCNTATGCGKGLQCIPSPCVVAPCTSGSCQKLER
jgi:hypothetical protein